RSSLGFIFLAFGTFFQLIRPLSVEERRAQRRYRASAQRIVGRVRAIFDAWVDLREVEPDYARLANANAVNRWELMRLVQEADRLQPPRSLVGNRRDLLNAVVGSARACQLLANGYRSHKSEAVCDGQALFLEVVEDLERLAIEIPDVDAR